MLSVGPDSTLLLFDLQEIERTDHLRQVLIPAIKHAANPVLAPGELDSWDSRRASPWASRSVIYDADDAQFKMWYAGYPSAGGRAAIRPQRTGYAVSDDGVQWHRPQLGQFTFNDDGGHNNICAETIGSVVKDPAERVPARRFKMFIKKPAGADDRMGMLYSADGIHWGDEALLPAEPWGGRRYDTVAFVRDELDPDPHRRFKLVWQQLTPAARPGPPRVRDKHLAFGPSELQWQASASNPLITPNDGLEQEIHFLAYVPYRSQYLLLYEFGWYHPDGSGRHGAYCADIRLAHSSNGEQFTRICPDQQVIERGAYGAWDDQFLVISDKIVVRDDIIYLYYSGQDRSWSSWPRENAVERPTLSAGESRHSSTGLATLAIDRFSALEVADRATSGCAVTQPMQLPAQPLALHANVSGGQPRRSWIQVEVLDAAERPLAGFARTDSVPLAVDDVAAAVWWRERRIAELAGHNVRLRTWIYGAARLHALSWRGG